MVFTRPPLSNRSREQNVILALCIVGGLGIAPFAIYRLMQGEILAGVVDTLIVMIVAGIFFYVLRTGNTRLPSIILTLSYMSVMVAVNYITGPSLIFWAYPTMAAAYFLVRPAEGLVINSVALAALLPALMIGTSNLEMAGLLITLILNNSFAYLYARFSLEHQDKLARMATRDALTGVGNRAIFVTDINKAVAEKMRFGGNLCLIMMDLDHFKQINDRFGHLSGDAVLVKLMDICRERLRGIDRVYRIGGEEFAIIAVGIEADGAHFLAEDIRRMVDESQMAYGISVTVSLGIASCTADDTIESLMSRADRALYRAKNQGRNQVCLEKDPPPGEPAPTITSFNLSEN